MQISCDICTCFAHYLYSTKQSWIITTVNARENESNSTFYDFYAKERKFSKAVLTSPVNSHFCGQADK